MEVAGRGNSYTISDVVFLLGPRITLPGALTMPNMLLNC